MPRSRSASPRIAATSTAGARSGSSGAWRSWASSASYIRAALAGGGDEDDGHDELGAACELLARRFPIPPDNPRDRDRALGFLVRKGYELELAHDALRRHAAAAVEN